MKPTDHPPEWQEHERRVAQAYRALGYSVTADINIGGQQVDLPCHKHIPGAGRISLYVECKHSATTGSRVSKDEVTQFIVNFHALKQTHGFTAGVMVAAHAFSQFAKTTAAAHPDIILTTLNELRNEFFGISDYLQTVLGRYVDDGLLNDYVELNASSEVGSPTLHPARDLFRTWLAEEEAPQLFLLGDFGAGKTTFFRRMQSELGRQFLEGSCDRMPLLVPLREVGEAEDGRELVERFFAQHLRTAVPYAVFEQFNAEGAFLLLLDGFDEMAAASDRVARHRRAATAARPGHG